MLTDLALQQVQCYLSVKPIRFLKKKFPILHREYGTFDLQFSLQVMKYVSIYYRSYPSIKQIHSVQVTDLMMKPSHLNEAVH